MENQGRLVSKFWGDAHQNIVTVLRWGQMTNSPFYFMDMELYDITLEDYISISKSDNVLLGKIVGTRGYENYLWNIIIDITRGLSFIHRNGETHKNLKPSNGDPIYGLANMKCYTGMRTRFGK
jgi:serine/threonine protein kinase